MLLGSSCMPLYFREKRWRNMVVMQIVEIYDYRLDCRDFTCFYLFPLVSFCNIYIAHLLERRIHKNFSLSFISDMVSKQVVAVLS